MMQSRTWGLLVVSVCLLGLAMVISWKGYEKHQEKEQVSLEVKKLQEEARQLEEETQHLSERIAYFQTPDYVELEVKERLNLRKPNESVAIIQADRFRETPMEISKGDEKLTKNMYEAPQQELSNPTRWWKMFFDFEEENINK